MVLTKYTNWEHPESNNLYSSRTSLYDDDEDNLIFDFVPVQRLDDIQAIRAAEFHPNGRYYAVGSNSKTLRVCEYPKSYQLASVRPSHVPTAPNIVAERVNHHRASIYCLAWNWCGNLLATGSNDRRIKLIRFSEEKENFVGTPIELDIHDGTIRDVCFMEDLTNGSSLLISGGAGDNQIHVTDCETETTFQSFEGHKGPILCLNNWGGAMFASGSTDKTIRLWDMRARECSLVVPAPSSKGAIYGTAVNAVCVDPSSRLLVSGHEDSNIMLYDIRGKRMLQTINPHTSDVKSLRFSHKSRYLLSGGSDANVMLTKMRGDLTQPITSSVVGEHDDVVIQARWHPNDFTFISTSGDKTAIVWALPK